MNTIVLTRGSVRSLISETSAGSVKASPAPTSAAADCWCIEPEAPPLEPLPAKAHGLAKPTAKGAALRGSGRQTKPADCPRRATLEDLLAFPPPLRQTRPPVLTKPAVNRPELAAPSRQAAGVGDVDEAKAFLQRAFKGDAFKHYAGEASAASRIAGTMSPSAARGLRDLDAKGLLGDAIADAGQRLTIPPHVLHNSVMLALSSYDRGITGPIAAKTDASRAAKSWLTDMLHDPKVSGNVLSEERSVRYIASKMPRDVARNLAARPEDVDFEIDRYCDKNFTGADAARISERLKMALAAFEKATGSISAALEKGASWHV